MEAVNAILAPTARPSRASVAAARARQALGWSGIAGLVLAIAAAGLLVTARPAAHDPLPESGTDTPIASNARSPADPFAPLDTPERTAPPAQSIELPPRSSIPVLTLQIAQVAIEQGIGWPQADYRTVEASSERAARLEIRCTLKAPYPALRRFLAELLQRLPSLTLHEFSMSRASVDSADVEAKLTLVVWLADDPAALPKQGDAR